MLFYCKQANSDTITSELPPLIVSDIKLSSQPSANAGGTIHEGSMATLTFNVSAGTGVYQYEAKIDDATVVQK